MYHVIIDKKTNAYIAAGSRHHTIATTSFLYLAHYFLNARDAVEALTRWGFGNEVTKRFRILHIDKARKVLEVAS